MILQAAESHGEGRHSQPGRAEVSCAGCGLRRLPLAERGAFVPALKWEEGIQGSLQKKEWAYPLTLHGHQ